MVRQTEKGNYHTRIVLLYTPLSSRNANGIFKLLMVCSLASRQQALNVFKCMCLTKVNNFSHHFACLCLLTISAFPLQRLQYVFLIAV